MWYIMIAVMTIAAMSIVSEATSIVSASHVLIWVTWLEEQVVSQRNVTRKAFGIRKF